MVRMTAGANGASRKERGSLRSRSFAVPHKVEKGAAQTSTLSRAPASALGKERGCSFRMLGQRRRRSGSPSTRRRPAMGRGSGGLDALFSTGGEGEADRPIEFRSSARGNWLRRECKRKSPRSLRYPGPPGEFRVTSALRSSADGVLFCLRTRRSLGFSQSDGRPLRPGALHCG